MGHHFAHSENRAGQKHDLVEHLQNVAALARGFAAKFDAGELAYWAGLWHDLGKFHPDFLAHVGAPGCRRGPDHSSAGMVHAVEALGDPLLAFVIGGHHGGLKSRNDVKSRLGEKQADPRVREALRIAAHAVEAIPPKSPLQERLPSFLRQPAKIKTEKADLKRGVEFFLRMLFSALVDADFLDTEAHFNPQRSEKRGAEVALDELWKRFEREQTQLMGKAVGPVSHLRREIYRHCLAAAAQPQGFFRLTAPTGGGKTRSGMGFSLEHALQHGLDRVIVAIPYTSIIEQTADAYREIFGQQEGIVVEHHSAIRADDEQADPVSYEETWSRLAAQNWDAPIIVTTTVQLFESLLANRPGRCRKLHNVARSVIVLDEVQTLPPGLLAPMLDVLRQLVEHYRVSVVLSTATQPALENSPYLQGLPSVQEIIPEPARYYRALKRVRYELPSAGERWPWQQVARRMREEAHALAVVNTKRDALALLDALDDPAALHLSTSMCGAHRRATLQEVRRRLKTEEPCRLVSTQVVEAGVDLDFPLVLRAIGPLDRIVQAAGRCNREGKLSAGHVVIFDPAEGTLPQGAYRSGHDKAAGMLRRQCDLDDPATYERYFGSLYQTVETDEKNIQSARERFDFRKVARRFRMIDDDTVPVVVRPRAHAAEVDHLVGLLADKGEPSRRMFQRLQPYLVSLPAYLISEYVENGLLEEVLPSLWRWLGRYDPIRGLVARGQDPESLVI